MNTTSMNFDTELSPREEQMTVGLLFGMCKKELAAKLKLSIHTVEKTVRNAMEKTGAKKSTDLVVWYMVKHYNLSKDQLLSLAQKISKSKEELAEVAKHFSIPLESLPKSLTAMVFLLLFFTATNHERTVRSSRVRRNEVEYLIES